MEASGWKYIFPTDAFVFRAHTLIGERFFWAIVIFINCFQKIMWKQEIFTHLSEKKFLYFVNILNDKVL